MPYDQTDVYCVCFLCYPRSLIPHETWLRHLHYSEQPEFPIPETAPLIRPRQILWTLSPVDMWRLALPDSFLEDRVDEDDGPPPLEPADPQLGNDASVEDLGEREWIDLRRIWERLHDPVDVTGLVLEPVWIPRQPEHFFVNSTYSSVVRTVENEHGRFSRQKITTLISAALGIGALLASVIMSTGSSGIA